MSTRTESAPSAGRPRSELAHQAILDAALVLLVESGFSALTVEGVASRAGVGKATIYRRWPSKVHLVIEAFSQLPGLQEVDTGELATDLEMMLRRYIEILNSTPLAAIVPSLAGERAHNPELSELFDPIVKERRRPILNALERARRRGEIRQDLDLELAADLIFGPIVMRVFFTGRRINPRILRPVIEVVLRGIRADPSRRRRGG
ncbi:MAG: TetR/AcrR family transcriptional regulator [Myxococcota bacterium]